MLRIRKLIFNPLMITKFFVSFLAENFHIDSSQQLEKTLRFIFFFSGPVTEIFGVKIFFSFLN